MADLGSDGGVEAFGKDLGSLTLTIWMLNSGATHGKQWESITKIDRAQLLATVDLDVKQGRVTAPSIQLRFSAAIACRMIEKAWTVYDLRRGGLTRAGGSAAPMIA